MMGYRLWERLGMSCTRSPPATLDLITALVEHSLLRQEEQADGEPRFSMLETVRAYALERLQASGQADAIQRRHAAWLIAFAEAVLPCLARTAQVAEVERVAPEIDNVRAAMSWALAHGDATMALRLSRATFQLWFVRAMPGEGRRWLEESLAVARDAPDLLRTEALLCGSFLAFVQGDLARQVALAEESLTVAQTCGYPFGVAVAIYQLGVAAEWRRDLDEATARYEEVLGLVRQIGEPYWIALLLSNLGEVSQARGRLAEARPSPTKAWPAGVRWETIGESPRASAPWPPSRANKATTGARRRYFRRASHLGPRLAIRGALPHAGRVSLAGRVGRSPPPGGASTGGGAGARGRGWRAQHGAPVRVRAGRRRHPRPTR